MKAITIISFGLFALTACSTDNTAAENKTATETPVKVVLTTPAINNQSHLWLSGQIESIQSSNITTRMMGFITKIYVNVGDKVEQGQILVSINNQDILAKKAQTVAALNEAEAALLSTQKDFDRYTQLYSKGSATSKELDNMTLQYNSAKSKVEMAKQMGNEVDAMMLYSNLKAPFAGIVTQKFMDEGNMAAPDMPILYIEQTGGFQVSASVSEMDIDKIKEGDNVSVNIKSINRIIQGKISLISQSSKNSGGQYLVKISLANEDSKGLYSGMYVNIDLPVAQPQNEMTNKILVPVSSIIYKDQLTGIYTVINKTAALRWLRVGKTWGNKIEVLSGLSKEEQFIENPSSNIENGTPVITN